MRIKYKTILGRLVCDYFYYKCYVSREGSIEFLPDSYTKL